jgi:hypothetical protein
LDKGEYRTQAEIYAAANLVEAELKVVNGQPKPAPKSAGKGGAETRSAVYTIGFIPASPVSINKKGFRQYGYLKPPSLIRDKGVNQLWLKMKRLSNHQIYEKLSSVLGEGKR